MGKDTVEKKVKNNYDFVDDKPNTYYQANQKNYRKDRVIIIEIFQEMEKLKREIMLTIETKKCQM